MLGRGNQFIIQTRVEIVVVRNRCLLLATACKRAVVDGIIRVKDIAVNVVLEVRVYIVPKTVGNIQPLRWLEAQHDVAEEIVVAGILPVVVNGGIRVGIIIIEVVVNVRPVVVEVVLIGGNRNMPWCIDHVPIYVPGSRTVSSLLCIAEVHSNIEDAHRLGSIQTDCRAVGLVAGHGRTDSNVLNREEETRVFIPCFYRNIVLDVLANIPEFKLLIWQIGVRDFLNFSVFRHLSDLDRLAIELRSP